MLRLPDRSRIPAESDVIKQQPLYPALCVRISIGMKCRIFRHFLCSNLLY